MTSDESDRRKANETYELRCRIGLLEQKIKLLERMLIAKPEKDETFFRWNRRLNGNASVPRATTTEGG